MNFSYRLLHKQSKRVYRLWFQEFLLWLYRLRTWLVSIRMRVRFLPSLGWVKDLVLPQTAAEVRCSSHLALLWLWCRPAATALIWPLAWELPYDTAVALKRKPKKNIIPFIHKLQKNRPNWSIVVEAREMITLGVERGGWMEGAWDGILRVLLRFYFVIWLSVSCICSLFENSETHTLVRCTCFYAYILQKKKLKKKTQ